MTLAQTVKNWLGVGGSEQARQRENSAASTNLGISRIDHFVLLEQQFSSLLTPAQWRGVGYAVTTAQREELAHLHLQLEGQADRAARLAIILSFAETVRQRSLLDVVSPRELRCVDTLRHLMPELRQEIGAPAKSTDVEIVAAAMRWLVRQPETRCTAALFSEMAGLFGVLPEDGRIWYQNFLSLFSAPCALHSVAAAQPAAEQLLEHACQRACWGAMPGALSQALEHVAHFNLQCIAEQGVKSGVFPFKPALLEGTRFIGMLARNNGACPKNAVWRAYVDASTPAEYLRELERRRIVLPALLREGLAPLVAEVCCGK